MLMPCQAARNDIDKSSFPCISLMSSDIDISSESEHEEHVSIPRAVVRNCTSCAKHLRVISDLKQEVAALKGQVEDTFGT